MEVDDIALGLLEGGQVDVNIVGVKEALTITRGVEVWQPAGCRVGGDGCNKLGVGAG